MPLLPSVVTLTLFMQELSNSQELLSIKDLEFQKLEITLQENIKQLSEKEVSFLLKYKRCILMNISSDFILFPM